MGVEKQLPLPNLVVPSRGRIAVFIGIKDVDTEPKILLARRPSGLYTFPGGKSKTNENPENTTLRELREETGWIVYSKEFIIRRSFNSSDSIRIAAGGVERDATVYYGFTDECMDDDTPQHLEPDKNDPWEWIYVKDIPAMVLRGELHPIVIKADIPGIVFEAREGFPYEDRNMAYVDNPEKYDFPHYGLHPDLCRCDLVSL